MEGTESLKGALKIQMIYALVSYNFYEIKSVPGCYLRRLPNLQNFYSDLRNYVFSENN